MSIQSPDPSSPSAAQLAAASLVDHFAAKKADVWACLSKTWIVASLRESSGNGDFLSRPRAQTGR